jgi:hypothetical protein
MRSSRESRVSALPAHLQEALRRRLAGEAGQPTDRIQPARRGGPLPLSFPQQRLWFLNEFQGASEAEDGGEAEGAGEARSAGEHDGAAYNSALPLRLTGPLDLAALTGALRELVARHESLRTTFDTVDGNAVQVVRSTPDLALSTVDLDGSAAGRAGPGAG